MAPMLPAPRINKAVTAHAAQRPLLDSPWGLLHHRARRKVSTWTYPHQRLVLESPKDGKPPKRPIPLLGRAVTTFALGRALSSDEPPEEGEESEPQGLTMGQTVLSLVITMIGAGIVALPGLVSRSGWILGVLFTLAIGAATLEVGQFLHWALTVADNDLVEAGEEIASIEEFGSIVMGQLGDRLARSSNTVQLIGVLAVFTILISDNLGALFATFGWSQRCWTLLVAPVLVLLGTMKDLTAMAMMMPVGTFATLAIGFLICVKATLDAQRWQSWPQAAQLEVHRTWPPSFLGLGPVVAVLFGSYGVIGTVPYIRSEMRDPSQFPSAFRRAMGAVSVAYVAVMLAGHYGYGVFCCGNVVLSLTFAPNGPAEAFGDASYRQWTGPESTVYGTIVMSLLTVHLFISFPVLCLVVVASVRKAVGADARCPAGTHQDSLLRAVIVFCVVAVAISTPYLMEIFALFSSVAGVLNNVVLPLLFAYRLQDCLEIERPSWRRSSWHVLIIALSCVCGVFGFIGSVTALCQKIAASPS